MQIVYISNRPKLLLETLGHVKLFMPFIDRAVACVPDKLIDQFANRSTSLPLHVIPESAILTNSELKHFEEFDHQRRNYLLRTRLATHSDIEEQFIMSDDDSRPLKLVALTQFLEEDRYHRYYFHDLRGWNSDETEFDAGQIHTCAILDYHNLPHLSYASHMPQIIDRALFLESAHFFATKVKNQPLCEWSSYFNYAGTKKMGKFHRPQAYRTLCWPEHPLAWKPLVQPAEYQFENFTPNCYSSRGVFEGFDTTARDVEKANHTNIEKIICWRKYEIATLHPEQGTSPLKYFNWRTWVNKLLKHLVIS